MLLASAFALPAEPIVLVPLALPAFALAEEDWAVAAAEEIEASGASLEKLCSENFVTSAMEIAKLTMVLNTLRNLEIEESSGRLALDGLRLSYEGLTVAYNGKKADADGVLCLSLDLSSGPLAVLEARAEGLTLSSKPVSSEPVRFTVTADERCIAEADKEKTAIWRRRLEALSGNTGKADGLASVLAYADGDLAKLISVVDVQVEQGSRSYSLKPLLDKASKLLPFLF